VTSKHRGILVTLDGPAGAGKSTTTRNLRQLLVDLGYSVYATAEPSRATLGEIARHHTEVFRGHSLACLVAADRYHHLDTELRPKRDTGHIVICDRYVASSYVLQRMDGVPVDFVEALNSAADVPDLAVILTVDAAVAATRVARRGAHNRFHTGVETAEQEIEFYRDAAARLTLNGFPIVTVDTSWVASDQTVADIASRITRLLDTPGPEPITA
jgi:dTMP kinase